jgi:mono/diheme cytochrome c family protein
VRRLLVRFAACLGFALAPVLGLAQAPAPDGHAVYDRECLPCHMANGRGVPGMSPPLVGSPWVTGSPEAFAGFVLTGGFGPDVLMGRFDYMSDEDLAAALTFIRQTFGSGASAVTPELVAKVRAQVVQTDGK